MTLHFDDLCRACFGTDDAPIGTAGVCRFCISRLKLQRSLIYRLRIAPILRLLFCAGFI